MEVTFLDVLFSVSVLILLMIPGIILAKTKILPKGTDNALSGLILYGCQPALMIMGFQKESYNPNMLINILIVAGITLGIYLITIFLVLFAFKRKDKSAKINCVRYATVFGNVGFMGIPFLKMLFPNSGEVLIYCSVVVAIFNLLNWSLGVYLITADKSNMSFRKAVLNPNTISVFIGLLLFVALKVPVVELATENSVLDKALTGVMNAVNYLAEAVTPLSMVVIGFKLASIKAKALFLDKWAYVTSFNRLILCSLFTMLVVAVLPVSNVVRAVLFFTMSMPSATSTALFATKFGGDGNSASVMVLLTTILSIITIPLMYLLYSQIVPFISTLLFGA